VICYRGETVEGTEHISSLEGPFLHIGNLSVPDRDSGSLEFYIRRTDFEQCFDDALGRIRSVIVKGPEQCDYSFPGRFDGVSGYFVSNCTTNFAVDSSDSFIDVLVFQSPGRGCPLIPTLSILSSDYHSTIGIFQHSDDFVSFNVDPSDRLIQTLNIPSSHSLSTTRNLQHSTDLISFGISEQLDSSLNQAGESTLVWIGIGSSLAAILLSLAAIIFLLGCRRLFSSATSLPESEIEGFTDSLFSFTEPDLLLSEQNALSSKVSIE
jgi:hypothetical protein